MNQALQNIDPATVILTILALVVGMVVGVILGLNGFAQPANTGLIGQSPRIKNLLYLFSGFFTVFVADFKKLGIPDGFHYYWPLGGYGLGAFGGAIFAVIYMVQSIKGSVAAFNAMHPESKLEHGIVVREYLTFGKAAYDKKFDEETGKLEASIAAHHEAMIEQRKYAQLQADKIAGACVYGLLNIVTTNSKLPHDDKMDMVINAINTKITAAAKKPPKTLRGSYMVYHPLPKTSQPLVNAALFTKNMRTKYAGFLELTRGSVRVHRDVILPVAESDRSLLPGAPEAVMGQNFSFLNIRDIKFRSEISKEVKEEIKDYFRERYWDEIASVTCVPVHDGGAVRGVVNIESSECDLIGEGEEAAKIVLGSLQSLIALLSVFE